MALLSGFMALGSALSSNGVLTELSGNGYARQAVALTLDTVAGVIYVSGSTFGPDTGSGWTAAIYAAVYDASTNGNLIMSFPIPSTTLAVGQSYTIPNSYVTLGTVARPLFVNGGTTVPPGTAVGVLTDLLATGLSGAAVTSGPANLSISTAFVLTASSISQPITYAATVTPSVALANTYTMTLTGNLTLNAPTNAIPGQAYRFFLTQDGTGSRLLTLGAGIKTAGGAPALSTAANAIDLLDFFYDGTTFWNRVFKAFA